MSERYRLALDADIADLEDALWEAYYAEEIAARGLRPGDSLDTDLQGRMVPAVTTRYLVAERPTGRTTEKVITLDNRAQAWNGRTVRVRGRNVVIDSAGVDKAVLPADVRDWIDGGRPAQSVVAPQLAHKPADSAQTPPPWRLRLPQVLRPAPLPPPVVDAAPAPPPPPETEPAPPSAPQPAKLSAAEYVHAQRPAEPRPPAGPPPRERLHVPTGAVIALVTLAAVLAAVMRHCG